MNRTKLCVLLSIMVFFLLQLSAATLDGANTPHANSSTFKGTQERNQAGINITTRYGSGTSDDSISNVPRNWNHALEVSLLNQEDSTHRSIMNPKITVDSSLDLIDFNPQPTIANPPTYFWTYEELPESDVWGVATILESDVPLKPRFSASRSVTPEYLVEEEIIQTFVVTFILEEELPTDMTTIGVYIGFTPGDYAKIKETVEYTLVGQKQTEDWEVDAVGYVGQPVAKWNTSPFMVEVGRTYQFEATFKVRKTQASLSSLICKPGVQILYSKVSFEVPVVGKSTSIEVSDIKITFEADEEIEWSERCVTSDLYDFWFDPVISTPETTPETTPKTTPPSETTPETTTPGQVFIPGFELLPAIAAIPAALYLTQRKK